MSVNFWCACPAGANGSAIYVNASLKAGISKTLAIYDSIMENNVATDAVSNTCGGGIASGPGVTSVTLDNVTMANNKADKGGSVCILGRCKISISSSSFRNSTGRYRH